MYNKRGYVYILTNKRNGALYVGVTSNLDKRILEHKQGTYGGFTKKYGCINLVRFQETQSITEAIELEKKLKGYSRGKKLTLIEQDNPNWEYIM